MCNKRKWDRNGRSGGGYINKVYEVNGHTSMFKCVRVFNGYSVSRLCVVSGARGVCTYRKCD